MLRVSESTSFDWEKLFKEGRERVEVDPHRRRKRTTTDDNKTDKLMTTKPKNYCYKIVD